MVFEELDRRFALLRESKVSKDDMAETLFELAMRMKGTEFVPKLKEYSSQTNTDTYIPLWKPERFQNALPDGDGVATAYDAGT